MVRKEPEIFFSKIDKPLLGQDPRIREERFMRNRLKRFVRDINAEVLELYARYTDRQFDNIRASDSKLTSLNTTVIVEGDLPISTTIIGKQVTHASLEIVIQDYSKLDPLEELLKQRNNPSPLAREIMRLNSKVINASVNYSTADGDLVEYNFTPVRYESDGSTSWDAYVTHNDRHCMIGTRLKGEDPFYDFIFDEETFNAMHEDISGILDIFKSKMSISDGSS